ncbi:hypothetical protein J6590_048962 [Homalodisca vitripennis]|nr:hypothetical protein J6590_048962 [Homalodisca vitripennis]
MTLAVIYSARYWENTAPVHKSGADVPTSSLVSDYGVTAVASRRRVPPVTLATINSARYWENTAPVHKSGADVPTSSLVSDYGVTAVASLQ